MNYDSLIYFWSRRTLFIGRPAEPLKMCQGAASLIVSLGEPVRYRSEDSEGYRLAGSILVPAGADYQVDIRGELVASIMLDAFGEDYSLLLGQMGSVKQASNGASFDGLYEQSYRQSLLEIYQQAMSYQSAYQALDRALLIGTEQTPRAHSIDPRIVAVVNQLKKRVDENLLIDDLAGVANLSVSRLVQLFRQQTGIPIRRYRCWHRLFVASVLVAKTGNLTQASITAGFTDASHFTKTFHNMVGMCPSKLLSQPQRVRLVVE